MGNIVNNVGEKKENPNKKEKKNLFFTMVRRLRQGFRTTATFLPVPLKMLFLVTRRCAV
jgi:hypothetical protein